MRQLRHIEEVQVSVMKKWILILLAAMMLGCSAAPAEGVIPNLRDTPTATPAAPAFSIRNGIQWNMTGDLVQALETVQLMKQERDGWSILLSLSAVEVSKYTADLVYMFYNDRLKMISYDFGSKGTPSDYQYLTGALDSVYGEHAEPAASAIVGVMDQIYPGYYNAERLLNRRGWTAADGTLIYLYYYAENAYAILYVCSGSSPVSYNTTGL